MRQRNLDFLGKPQHPQKSPEPPPAHTPHQQKLPSTPSSLAFFLRMESFSFLLTRGPLVAPLDENIKDGINEDDGSSCNSSKATAKASNVSLQRGQEVGSVRECTEPLISYFRATSLSFVSAASCWFVGWCCALIALSLLLPLLRRSSIFLICSFAKQTHLQGRLIYKSLPVPE